MLNPLLANVVAVALLLVAAVGAASLFRRAGAPGWAVIGGAVAGVIIGPTIFGRIAPQTYEHLFVGGVEERDELQQVERRQAADILVAIEAGADRDGLRREHAAELEPYRAAVDAARWRHQQPMRIATIAVVAMTLLLGAMQRIDRGNAPQTWGSVLSVGIWAAAFPGALAFSAMHYWWGETIAASALGAACVMIGPWALTNVDRDAADMAELGGAWMIQQAGRVATVIALAVISWAIWTAHDALHLVWAAVLLALPAGWLLSQFAPALASSAARGSSEWRDQQDDFGQGRGYAVAQYLLLPILAACVAARIELIEQFAFWPLLVLLLLSGDGRWVGALTGAMVLGGRAWLRTMRLVLGSMACGPTQLAVLAVSVHLWLLPDELPLAILVGAIVIEATTPARRRIARELTEAEEQWPPMSND